jgi:hypothetical protein
MIAPVSDLGKEIARVRDLDLSCLRARWQSVFRRRLPTTFPGTSSFA